MFVACVVRLWFVCVCRVACILMCLCADCDVLWDGACWLCMVGDCVCVVRMCLCV